MPAPSPSIIAITLANDGRSSGAASAVSRIWPAMTPISAPTSVTAIAANERKRIVSRMKAIAMPTSSPTGNDCSDARSISTPRSSTWTPLLPSSAVSAASISAWPSLFSKSCGSFV